MTFLYKVLFPCILNTCTWYHLPLYMLLIKNIQAEWLSGLCCLLKAAVTSVSWVQVQLQLFCWHSYTKYFLLYFEDLHMVSSTIINAIDHKTCRQNGWVVYVTCLRPQPLLWRGLESHSCRVDDIPIQNIVSFILNTSTEYLLPSSMLLINNKQAKWLSDLCHWLKAPAT